jgi:sec-independent protein translocase protein TatA
MPFGLHPIWAIALIVIVLILFGVGRLPSVGQALGRTYKEFRTSLKEEPPPDDKRAGSSQG